MFWKKRQEKVSIFSFPFYFIWRSRRSKR